MSQKQKEKAKKSGLKPFDVIYIAVLVILMFILILFPESGEKVMVTNTLRLAFNLLMLLYAIIGLLRSSSFFNTRPKKVCQITVIVCLIGVGALCCMEHYLDLTGETKTVILYDTEVTSRRGGGKLLRHEILCKGEGRAGRGAELQDFLCRLREACR